MQLFQNLFKQDIFADVKGRDNVKLVFKRALHASKPVHILLVGPPSAGKTVFGECILKAYGRRAIMFHGKNASKAGALNKMVRIKPKITIIDELEKAGKDIREGLLNILEDGTLKYTLRNKDVDEKIDTSIIATCNNIDELEEMEPEFLDRMEVIKVPPYTEDEYYDVARFKLAKDGIKGDLAEYIAQTVYQTTGKMNLRKCIRVGSMCKTQHDVDEYMQSLEGLS